MERRHQYMIPSPSAKEKTSKQTLDGDTSAISRPDENENLTMMASATGKGESRQHLNPLSEITNHRMDNVHAENVANDWDNYDLDRIEKEIDKIWGSDGM